MTFPVYNMEVDSPGIVAELGFKALGFVQVLPVTVRPGDSGLTVMRLPLPRSPNRMESRSRRGVFPPRTCMTPNAARSARRSQKSVGRNALAAVTRWTSRCGRFWRTQRVVGPSRRRCRPIRGRNLGATPKRKTQVGPIVECERVPFPPVDRSRPDDRLRGILERPEHPAGRSPELGVPGSDRGFELARSRPSRCRWGTPRTPRLRSALGACTTSQLERKRSPRRRGPAARRNRRSARSKWKRRCSTKSWREHLYRDAV